MGLHLIQTLLVWICVPMSRHQCLCVHTHVCLRPRYSHHPAEGGALCSFELVWWQQLGETKYLWKGKRQRRIAPILQERFCCQTENPHEDYGAVAGLPVESRSIEHAGRIIILRSSSSIFIGLPDSEEEHVGNPCLSNAWVARVLAMHNFTVKGIKLKWAGTCCADPCLMFPGVHNQEFVGFFILFYLSPHFLILILSSDVTTGSVEGRERVDLDTWYRIAHTEVSLDAGLPRASWEMEPEFRGKKLDYFQRQDNRLICFIT